MLAGDLIFSSEAFLLEDQSVREAFELFQSNRLSLALVFNNDKKVTGVVDKDCFFKTLKDFHWDMPVSAIMSNNFEVISEKTLLPYEMEDNNVKHLVVKNIKGGIKGIIPERYLRNYILQRSQLKIRQVEAILSSAHVGIVAINRDGRIFYFNQAAEQIVWRKREEVLGKHISNVIIPQGLLQVMETGEPQLCHKFTVEYSSRTHTYLTHRTPIWENDQVVGAVAVFQDVSEIEAISEELSVVKQLNRELETIIEASYDGILVSDKEGTSLRMNKALKRLCTISPHLIPKKSDQEEDADKNTEDIVSKVIEQKERVNSIVNCSGRQFMLTGNPIFDSNKNIERVLVNVRDLTELNSLKAEVEQTKELNERYQTELNELKTKVLGRKGLITSSKAMQKVIDLSLRVSQVESTVLILGESGVGKEVIANLIHSNSKRKEGPFIKVNCAAIPENLLESELFGYQGGAFTGASKEGKMGMFQLANKGTIFLDEIGDLPLQLQVKLLRVIQEKEVYRVGAEKVCRVDVRIIAATNKNLKEMVQRGEFREDLYFRLNVVPVNIPPLRERTEEIIPLIRKFQEKFSEEYSIKRDFSAESMEALVKYHWPGNIRELENTVERIIVTSPGPRITLDDLPDTFTVAEQNSDNSIVTVRGISPLKKVVREAERQLLEKAIERYGSAYKAAKVLGVNQSTITRKLAELRKLE